MVTDAFTGRLSDSPLMRAGGQSHPCCLWFVGRRAKDLHQVNREVSSPAEEQQQDGLPIPRRYWSAAAIWLALSMAVLDGSIANVALPTIAHDLGASAATSVWIVNAYQLTITVLLLPLAAVGDRCGYRFIYIPGLALFTLGSVGCAISDSL